jgi:hypothetical protein
MAELFLRDEKNKGLKITEFQPTKNGITKKN